MKEQFVTYEIALKLKELGFEEKCLAGYYEEDFTKKAILLQRESVNNQNTYGLFCSAPLWQQAIDWFRKKHAIHLEFVYSQDHNKYSWSGWDEYHWREISKRPRVEGRFPYPYKSRFKEHYWNHQTYEEAREQAVLKVIELCKK